MKVIAYNYYGDSIDSLINSDVFIRTKPEAPELTENILLRTKSTMYFTWSVPFNGGTPIIDYSLSFKYGVGIEIVYKSHIKNTFMLVNDLIIGNIYTFKI